jgi:hypothetical protein
VDKIAFRWNGNHVWYAGFYKVSVPKERCFYFLCDFFKIANLLDGPNEKHLIALGFPGINFRPVRAGIFGALWLGTMKE